MRGPRTPIRCLSALEVAQYLKSSKCFSKVVDASHRYDHGKKRPTPEQADLGRNTLDRAQSRLDLVDALILRRRWNADRIFDRVESIHVYSDSSPVTGEELQGMLMDVFYVDGEHQRAIVPGCTLAYGCFNAVSKAMALVWAAWLVAGPSEEGLQYVFSKVATVITDHGTEIHMLEVPNTIRAFIRWNQGLSLERCAPSSTPTSA